MRVLKVLETSYSFGDWAITGFGRLSSKTASLRRVPCADCCRVEKTAILQSAVVSGEMQSDSVFEGKHHGDALVQAGIIPL